MGEPIAALEGAQGGILRDTVDHKEIRALIRDLRRATDRAVVIAGDALSVSRRAMDVAEDVYRVANRAERMLDALERQQSLEASSETVSGLVADLCRRRIPFRIQDGQVVVLSGSEKWDHAPMCQCRAHDPKL
jgi:hypothetical protein